MSLAINYAQVFKTLDTKKVLAYMKRKGHLRVLPQVVRILQREKPAPSTTVTKKDDPRIVGGSLTLDGYTLTDRTYRTALVSLYQKIISYQ